MAFEVHLPQLVGMLALEALVGSRHRLLAAHPASPCRRSTAVIVEAAGTAANPACTSTCRILRPPQARVLSREPPESAPRPPPRSEPGCYCGRRERSARPGRPVLPAAQPLVARRRTDAPTSAQRAKVRSRIARQPAKLFRSNTMDLSLNGMWPPLPHARTVHHVSEHPSTMSPVRTPAREGGDVFCMARFLYMLSRIDDLADMRDLLLSPLDAHPSPGLNGCGQARSQSGRL